MTSKEKRSYGFFRCPSCHKQWESSHVYGNFVNGKFKVTYGQQCKTCNIMTKPYRTEPLKCRECGMESCSCVKDKRHIDAKKPHRSDLCERTSAILDPQVMNSKERRWHVNHSKSSQTDHQKSVTFYPQELQAMAEDSDNEGAGYSDDELYQGAGYSDDELYQGAGYSDDELYQGAGYSDDELYQGAGYSDDELYQGAGYSDDELYQGAGYSDDEDSEDGDSDDDDLFAGDDLKRRYGFFKCTSCRKSWESSHVYCYSFAGTFEAKYGQECKHCKVMVKPYRTEPLKCRECGMEQCTCSRYDGRDKRNIDAAKPHRRDLCGKCRAGFPCQ
ncbi:hypothetical protein RRG08_027820 [Elysia crispata]|uniref:3CxxC-type domain-containing protein n=1 Tax=Elysia crispata TaxID=231223 RepID=A0AAE1D6G1_9GAST|nr:hypothetical protein RRG08_027820 [Elysia crispata]